MDIVSLAMAKQYTDSQRLGYVETTPTMIIPDGKIELTNGFEEVDIFAGTLQVGATYIVTWDGSQHNCKATTITVEGMTAVTLGNSYWLGGPDTGEPFLFFDAGSEFVVIDIELWTAGDGSVVNRAIGLSVLAETIHHINQKFIPPLDSLTLNGADGKQYRLTIDENGALVIAAIT